MAEAEAMRARTGPDLSQALVPYLMLDDAVEVVRMQRDARDMPSLLDDG